MGSLSVWCVTFNQAGRPCGPGGAAGLAGGGPLPDLCAVGAQEVADPGRWEAALRGTALGGHTLVAGGRIGGICLHVFAAAAVAGRVARTEGSKVATGFGNVATNKGAVGVRLHVRPARDEGPETVLTFVNCHLAAHAERVVDRNADFHRIARKLFRASEFATAGDAVFWMGDLNYRVDGNRKGLDTVLGLNMRDVMLANDQLRREMRKGKVFFGFREGPLDFRPTYKYDFGTDQYDTSEKCRVPSWTDRILWRTNAKDLQRGAQVRLDAYEAVEEVKWSDHRPVRAAFTVREPQQPSLENNFLVKAQRPL